jgi:hypothetical protein
MKKSLAGYAPKALSTLEASTLFTRGLGLFGVSNSINAIKHSELQTNTNAAHGLLLRSCSSVHTFCMSYSIAVVYLDCDCRVLRVVPELKPWRASMHRSAAMTLEIGPQFAQYFRVGALCRVS